MIKRIKSSAFLLVFLGVLLSIPIVAKTLATHGVFAALVTGLIVVVLVFIGPLSFAIAGLVEADFAVALAVPTSLQLAMVMFLGLLLCLSWFKLASRGRDYSFPYLAVTGWGFVGACFCLLQVFTHIG
jgi:hypothetical protein